MDLESETVSGAVDEGVGEVVLGEHLSARRVDRSLIGTVSHGGDTGGLSGRRRRRRAVAARPTAAPGDEGTGHVAAVAVDLGAEVDDDEVVGFDDPIARTVVRQRGVRARRHDGLEADVVGSAQTHGLIECESERTLGRPLVEHGERREQRLVGDGRGTNES